MLKKAALLFSFLLFTIPAVHADVILPVFFILGAYQALAFILVIIIETFAWRWLAKRFYQAEFSFWSSLFIVFIANLISTICGFIIGGALEMGSWALKFHFYSKNTYPLALIVGLFILFILSVIIEWISIFLLFRKKVTLQKKEILKLSFIINVFSYALLVIFAIILFILHML
jgi:hypothetical protein